MNKWKDRILTDVWLFIVKMVCLHYTYVHSSMNTLIVIEWINSGEKDYNQCTIIFFRQKMNLHTFSSVLRRVNIAILRLYILYSRRYIYID